MTHNKKYTALITATSLSLAAPSQAILVAHYNGDDLIDKAAGGVNENLTNTGIDVNVAGGRYGNAYEFDDTGSDILQATLSYGVGGTDLGTSFTIMAWVNLDTDANPAGNSSNRFFLWEDASDFEFSAWLDSPNQADATANLETYLGSVRVETGTHTKGTWQHVAQTISFNSGTNLVTMETFLDGVSTGTARTFTDAGFGDVAINLGRARNSASDRPFDGKFDDIKFYDEVLDAAGIQAASVPEPSSAALLGLGGLALILRRRK